MMKERDQKKALRIAAGILLAAGLLSWTLPVIASQASENRQQRQSLQEMAKKESDYRDALRETLAENGYTNAGITMTKVLPEEGIIAYEVRLHHKRLCSAQEETKNGLLAELEAIPLEIPGSRLTFEII